MDTTVIALILMIKKKKITRIRTILINIPVETDSALYFKFPINEYGLSI